MPYKLQKEGDLYYVVNSDTGRKHSNKPLPRSRAVAQMRLLYGVENGTVTKAANYGARAGQQIIGRLVRGANGQFGSGDATSVQSDANATIAQNRAANAAAPKTGGRKRRAAKPRKARAKKPKAARAKKPKAASKVQQKRQQEREAVFNAMKDGGLNRPAFDAITALADGGAPAPDMLSALAGETGLAELTADGSYQLTPAGRSYVRAANRGNVDQAKRALVKGQRAVEDATTTKETDPVVPGPMVFKDHTGRLRWVLFSSTAYRDRDKEIVSTKALTDDVARADLDGDFGPLRWWHMPNVDIGDCDFNAITGRVLVESGTFRNEAVGLRVKEHANTLRASLGFHHPASEPDGDGVFSHIRRFERSLLPAEYASNPYTMLPLVVQEGPMDQPKKDALKALLGDDKLLEQLLTQADATTKAAEQAGVAFKEAEAAPVVAAVETPVGDDDIAVGDMSPAEYIGLQRQANQPLVDALGTFATAMVGERTKAAGIETRLATVEATATKAAETAAAVPDLATQLAQAQTALKAAQVKIAALEGDLPKSLKERQASQSDATVVSLTEKQIETMQPGSDPGFMGFVFGAPAQQGA